MYEIDVGYILKEWFEKSTKSRFKEPTVTTKHLVHIGLRTRESLKIIERHLDFFFSNFCNRRLYEPVLHMRKCTNYFI